MQFFYSLSTFLYPIFSFIFSLLSSNRKLIKSLLSTWKIRKWMKDSHCRMSTLSYKIQFSYLYSNVPLFLAHPTFFPSPFPSFLRKLDNQKLKGKCVLPSEKFEWIVIEHCFRSSGPKFGEGVAHLNHSANR